MINVAWKTIFEEAGCYTIHSIASDRLPLLVDWVKPRKPKAQRCGSKKNGLFRFNNEWTKESESGNIITQVWVKKNTTSTSTTSNTTSFLSKIDQTRKKVGEMEF